MSEAENHNLLELLFEVFKADDADALREYLQKVQDVNRVDESGNFLLYLAAMFGAAECMKLILQAGANVNQCNKEKETALHEAAFALTVDKRKNFRPDVCILLLLQAGAKPSVRTKQGKTPLDKALFLPNYLRVAILRIAAQAEKSPMMQAVWNTDTEALASLLAQQPGRLMRMLGKKSAVNDADENGYTPLHAAVLHGRTACLPMLLAAGAAPDVVSRDSTTPLMLATLAGDTVAMQILLKAGASPDVANGRGDTPLICAVKAHRAECVRILLERGAMVNAWNVRHETALFHATKNPEIMRMLLDSGAAVNGDVMIECASQGDSEQALECMRMLIAAGGDVNEENNPGGTPILWTESRGNGLEMMKLLLSAGADISRQNRSGNTILHNKAMACNLEAIRLLLEAGADPGIRNADGCTPRECAQGEDAAACRELLEAAMRERGISIIDKPVMKVSDIRRRLRRKAVIFRSALGEQAAAANTSWLGRVTRRVPGEEWPEDANGHPLVPLATLFLQGLPVLPPTLKKLTVITIFAPQDTWGEDVVDTPQMGCVIRSYADTDELETCDYAATEFMPCMLTPEPVSNDMPKFPDCGGSDELWDNIEKVEQAKGLDYLENILEADYQTHKIGGYPTYVQGAPDIPRGYAFVFQICSDKTAGFYIGDCGNYYFYYNARKNDWIVHADTY